MFNRLPIKLLPLQCESYYLPHFISEDDAVTLFTEIMGIMDAEHKSITMADGHQATAETATFIFADEQYTTFDAIGEVWGGRAPWTASLACVKESIFQQTGIRFQLARCVYYKDGSEGVSFHQDLPAFGSTAHIVSLSLGAERNFSIREVNSDKPPFVIRLATGSLLYMGEGFQDVYEHALPLDNACGQPRLNLTFRCYGWG